MITRMKIRLFVWKGNDVYLEIPRKTRMILEDTLCDLNIYQQCLCRQNYLHLSPVIILREELRYLLLNYETRTEAGY